METSSPKKLPTARDAALDLMAAVMGEEKILSDVAPKVLGGMSPAEAARANRLANGVFRNMQRCDRVLGRFVRQLPPDDVMNALRLATYEMLALGEAPHGVVSTAVNTVRKRSGEAGLGRMANAVLRKVAGSDLVWADLPVPELPKTLRKPLMAAYGGAKLRAIEAVQAGDPPVDLSCQRAVDIPAAVTLPTGSLRLAHQGQVSALPGFKEGSFWVQDAAAALPVPLLGDVAGTRVLDMCAAPGGKTMQLAAAGATVTALDVSKRRIKTVAENLARTGLVADLVTADALEWAPDAPFDAVLLDAPCSATGTLRRNPDLPFAKRALDLEPLLALQAGLFDRAAALLRPGGRLVFCTCSLLPEEGEAQLASALSRHPQLALDPIAPGDLPGLHPDWVLDGALRITPDTWAEHGGIDGFFIARLKRAE
ncbi:MAG: RsmB/NOP family class I SAM-dependent RNA methyltransferase [Pseudomonadota bacterium]